MYFVLSVGDGRHSYAMQTRFTSFCMGTYFMKLQISCGRVHISNEERRFLHFFVIVTHHEQTYGYIFMWPPEMFFKSFNFCIRLEIFYSDPIDWFRIFEWTPSPSYRMVWPPYQRLNKAAETSNKYFEIDWYHLPVYEELDILVLIMVSIDTKLCCIPLLNVIFDDLIELSWIAYDPSIQSMFSNHSLVKTQLEVSHTMPSNSGSYHLYPDC